MTTQSQILTYTGSAAQGENRKYNDCKSSRKCCQSMSSPSIPWYLLASGPFCPPTDWTCLTDRFVPAGDPGAGDPMSCEEYPFSSAIEGGSTAQTSCVSEYFNSAAGNDIGGIVNGKHKGFKYLFYVTGVDCGQFTEDDLYPCNP